MENDEFKEYDEIVDSERFEIVDMLGAADDVEGIETLLSAMVADAALGSVDALDDVDSLDNATKIDDADKWEEAGTVDRDDDDDGVRGIDAREGVDALVETAMLWDVVDKEMWALVSMRKQIVSPCRLGGKPACMFRQRNRQ